MTSPELDHAGIHSSRCTTFRYGHILIQHQILIGMTNWFPLKIRDHLGFPYEMKSSWRCFIKANVCLRSLPEALLIVIPQLYRQRESQLTTTFMYASSFNTQLNSYLIHVFFILLHRHWYQITFTQGGRILF